MVLECRIERFVWDCADDNAGSLEGESLQAPAAGVTRLLGATAGWAPSLLFGIAANLAKVLICKQLLALTFGVSVYFL